MFPNNVKDLWFCCVMVVTTQEMSSGHCNISFLLSPSLTLLQLFFAFCVSLPKTKPGPATVGLLNLVNLYCTWSLVKYKHCCPWCKYTHTNPIYLDVITRKEPRASSPPPLIPETFSQFLQFRSPHCWTVWKHAPPPWPLLWETALLTCCPIVSSVDE